MKGLNPFAIHLRQSSKIPLLDKVPISNYHHYLKKSVYGRSVGLGDCQGPSDLLLLLGTSFA